MKSYTKYTNIQTLGGKLTLLSTRPAVTFPAWGVVAYSQCQVILVADVD